MGTAPASFDEDLEAVQDALEVRIGVTRSRGAADGDRQRAASHTRLRGVRGHRLR
ncbi:hypothetical protein AB0L53_49540 [Nonomuraea sp. NPDC052129]|uniref:hypothetical protein n=1 Tax=Nonomuraea sp. NPDC052129 TaxID=3154651 RepID=UPI00342DF1B1